MKTCHILCALALSGLLATQAHAWNAEVTSVHDGDTISVINLETKDIVRIRLHGIDAPELPGKAWQAQPYSKVARDFVRGILPIGQHVAVMDMGFDKYTRTVAGVISLPDGTVIQESLLEAGLAWVYPKYCQDCRQWKAMQDKARDQGKGLWRNPDPTPPWVWRGSN